MKKSVFTNTDSGISVWKNPALRWAYGAEKVFLCANGTRDDVSDEIQAFLQYVAGEKPTTEITKKLDQLVLDAREHKEWRLEYMTLLERDERMREEGRAEGREEGREEGRAEEHKNTLREKQRADEAEKRASEAERRADEAEKRAAEAEKRADEAIQRAKESDQHFRIVEQQMAMMQDQIAALQK